MIDWDKPIQTTHGRPAKVLSKFGYWFEGETYCVVQAEFPSGNSVLYVVNPTTGRSTPCGTAFRNVPVKRDKWIILTELGPSMSWFDRHEDAKNFALRQYGDDKKIVIQRVDWEE